MADVAGWERAVSFADDIVGHLAEDHGVQSIGGETDGAGILTRRESFTGLHSEPPWSAGHSCRLLPVTDGWIAVNLPRVDDIDLLPAWLDLSDASGADDVPWEEIISAVARIDRASVVEAAQELGLAVAAVPNEVESPDAVDVQLTARDMASDDRSFRATNPGPRLAQAKSIGDLRVVDLSSLWAGPLCSRILTDAGADVVKVESTGRPDGARFGNRPFFDWLHDGQSGRSIDFASTAGIAELKDLIGSADIIIEGSRPRAFEQLGIEPSEVVGARPGVVWVSITAYGRTGPWRNWSGFGDDAAAAGGLVDRVDGAPRFVGDAIADPLTGLVAASAVLDAVAHGGGVHIDVALREVARRVALAGTLPR